MKNLLPSVISILGQIFYLSDSSRIRISGSSEAEHVVLGASFGSRPNLGTLERGRSQARTWWSTSGTSTRGSPVQVSVLPASLTATRTRSCCWKLLICSSSPPTQKNSLCVFVLLDDDVQLAAVLRCRAIHPCTARCWAAPRRTCTALAHLRLNSRVHRSEQCSPPSFAVTAVFFTLPFSPFKQLNLVPLLNAATSLLF